MGGLLSLGQGGKGGLRFHKAAHQGGGMGLDDGGEQGFLAGKIAVKSPGGHPGVLDDLPQRRPQKALVQEFGQGGPLDLFEGLIFVRQKGTHRNWKDGSLHDAGKISFKMLKALDILLFCSIIKM